MTVSGRTTLATAAVTLAALGTVGPAHATTASRASDPLHGAPTVGACSTMTAKQAAARSDRSTVVACSASHTAEVAGVVRLPDRIRWKTASADSLFRVVVDRCRPQVNAVLGRDDRTRDSSAYDYAWFAPTKAQRLHGARWLSCSVVLRRANGLAPLPKTASPFLAAGALPDRVARCLTKLPASTTCSTRHLWRAAGTFVVSGPFPGAKALDKKAVDRCASRVQAGKAYRWTYRDKITWNVGRDHVVVCYSRTKT